MDIDLLVVPYDSGQRAVRMGAGPHALIEAGLVRALEERGHDVRPVEIRPSNEEWCAEIRTTFDIAAALAHAVRGTRNADRFPLILAGNCSAAIGVVAGLEERTALLWMDAHGDFNTPETTEGGFLDGMTLAIITGRCWTALARRVPGFAPLPDSRVWLLGARDLDRVEQETLEGSGIRRLPAAAADSLLAELNSLTAGEPLYVHLDLDVLDAGEGRANAYAAPAGVSADALAAACRTAGRHAPLAALSVSAYDPAHDTDGRAARAAIRAISAALGG